MYRNNNNHSNSSKLWLAGLITVIGVAFVLYRHHRVLPEAGLDNGAAMVNTGGKTSPKADKFGVAPGYHSMTAESRFLIDIPWNEFSLASDGSLHISLEPRKWCTVGDLDVIAVDAKLSDNPRFLLTVEPLNPDDTSFAPIIRSLTPSELKNGFRYSFKLPELKKGTQAGIFLCKDNAGLGRCNTEGREPIDLNRALADNKERGAKDKAYRAPDRVYYFQYLYLSGNNRVSAFMNPEVPDITFDAVNERLKNGKLASKDLEDQQRALGRAKRFQQTLRSMPLEQGAGFARIVLPQMDLDRKHCPKVAAGDTK